MAQKRMFDRAIIDTDKFMDLPISAKAIYFLMGIEADDEGFVSPKKVLRLHGGSEDDVKVLIAKKFVIPFESGVVVITDWHTNNYLDKNRIKPTQYVAEKSKLSVIEVGKNRNGADKKYTLTDDFNDELNMRLTGVKLEEKRIEENRREENSEKNNYGEFKNVRLTQLEYNKLCRRYGFSATDRLIEELSSYMKGQGKKYKDHYATLLNWAKRKNLDEVKNAPQVVHEELTTTQISENKARLAKLKANLKFN